MMSALERRARGLGSDGLSRSSSREMWKRMSGVEMAKTVSLREKMAGLGRHLMFCFEGNC